MKEDLFTQLSMISVEWIPKAKAKACTNRFVFPVEGIAEFP
jgi:hypothetical protein